MFDSASAHRGPWKDSKPGFKSWLSSRWHNPRWRRRVVPRIGALLITTVLCYTALYYRGEDLASLRSIESTANSTSILTGDSADSSTVTPIVEPSYPSDDSRFPGGCMKFEARLYNKPQPLSKGKYQLPYVRPPPACRTFNLSSLEALIDEMRTTIHDPDLFRLFENAFPNTLDTMIKWYGYANVTDPDTQEDTMTDEELTYIITGDIDAMWLRDSAAQLMSYSSLLVADDSGSGSENTPTLARLWRGLVNMQARHVLISPYCHSFQPPRESGIRPTRNAAYSHNHPYPPYDRTLVFDCKWELDSLAYFLQISATYFEKTADLAFFGRYNWIDAVTAAVDAAGAMREGTYDAEGHVLSSAYTFTGWTDRGSETLTNNGLGNPSVSNGMVRTSFRPSDDATIFQFLVPANMMWASSLERASAIMQQLAALPSSSGFTKQGKAENLTLVMRQFAQGVRSGIAQDAVVRHRTFGDIFAYEVDGYGSVNLMDDANIPSLLSIPLLGFLDTPLQQEGSGVDRRSVSGSDDVGVDNAKQHHEYAQTYANTRRFALSPANPYFAWGEKSGFAAVGGPHLGPGRAWPMASIVTALTTYIHDVDGGDRSSRDTIVALQLNMLLNSTFGTGVMHESIDTWAPHVWTRPWFGWANGLFGELVLAIAKDDKQRQADERLLSRSWQ
ncbi:hypothetical protein HMPREF1624_01491 [Sporothrix schenckii ATCC 58251]|uniref:Uncharacterized protein n=1 Tax=Sporothrix schenckii (strain ATCC 58251 / de Perez 2211183) TaxID=1391915 RepID=U7Q8T4_SPOS1|nr:hypothetical protein HMPREF1624_01491 [Sporothrix schenckii ATCC 58251]